MRAVRDPVVVHLVGLPGTGKTTLTRFLAGRFDLEYVSSGDIVRAALAGQDGLRSAFDRCRHGHLPPYRLITREVTNRLGPALAVSGPPAVLVDGFPRSVGQVRAYQRWRQDRVRPIRLHVLLLDGVSREEIVGRTSRRRVCTGCDGISAARFASDRVECPSCSTVMTERADGADDAVRQRIRTQQRHLRGMYDELRSSCVPVTVLDATDWYALSASASDRLTALTGDCG